MRELKNTCRAAIVQATPVMFDKARSLERPCVSWTKPPPTPQSSLFFPNCSSPATPTA